MYFVSWIVGNKNPIGIGNAVIESDLRGQQLVRYIIDEVTRMIPGATIMSVSKID